jgi:hypothetical protein
MEKIEDIVAEIREMERHAVGGIVPVNPGRLADRIEASVKAYNKLREVIGGVCLHCDLQTACQKREDGMSTTCNAVAKATHFIEQHTEPESGKDLPF